MREQDAVRIAKALGDATRFAILKTIATRGELSCGELAGLFPIAQATVSHHLNVLVNAGLVEMRKQGQHHFFRLQKEALERFGRHLLQQLVRDDNAKQGL